jgi:hypothetical protein
MNTLKDTLRILNDICPNSQPVQKLCGRAAVRDLNNCDLEFLEDGLARALDRVREVRRPRKAKYQFPRLTEGEKELILAGKSGDAR